MVIRVNRLIDWLVDDYQNVIGYRKKNGTQFSLGAPILSNTSGTRSLVAQDVGSVIKANSANPVLLIIEKDELLDLTDANFTPDITAYQAGAGAVAFVAGAGVTLRGVATSSALYGSVRIRRVGPNEWAYWDAGGSISSNPAVSSVSSATQLEGNILVHTVVLASAPTSIANYAFTLAGSTATIGTDFDLYPSFSSGVSLAGGFLSVPPGVATFTISVTSVSDTVDEGAYETYSLIVGGVAAVGTITDDDDAPAIASVSSASATEGTAIVHTVTLTNASSSPTTFACFVSGTPTGGTATAGGVDFTATLNNGSFTNGVTISGSVITVPAMVSSFTVSVQVTPDALVEGNETYTLYVGGTEFGIGTIIDDDFSGTTVSTVSSNSATEGTSIVHTVTLSGATSGTVAYSIALTGVTASGSGVDFTSTLTNAAFNNSVTISGGLLSVPNGVSSFTVTVPTTADTINEANETYTLTVGGVSGTGTINNDDSVPTVSSVSSASATEASGIAHTVVMSNTSSSAQTYTLTLSGGTATGSGTDYTSALTSAAFSAGVTISGGTITVPAGVSSFVVTVPTTADTIDELNETYTLTVGGVSGTGTITDDDAAPAISSVSSNSANEGTAIVHTVALTNASYTTTTFALSLSGGTATGGGTDYTSTLTNGAFSAGVTISGGNITVPAGVLGFTVSVPTVADGIFESNETYNLTIGGVTGVGTLIEVGTGESPETFFFNISSASGAFISDSQGIGTISQYATPTISSVTTASGNEGTTLAHTVTLSSAVALAAATYTYSLSGGTATSGTDYTVPPTFSNGVTLSSGILTVPIGVSSFTVSVAAISDGSSESGETYNLTIGGVTGVGTIGDVTGGPITPSISASRTTGTAPLAVFFDASGTTASTLTSLPFHELLYSWDFGDGTGTFWSYGTKAGTADKNYAYGPEAAHVFLTAGSKTVTLTVIHISSVGTITTASTTQVITVTAESTTYPDSSCYYIDSVAAVTPGSGGVPAASTGIQTSSMTTAVAARTTATRKFFFKRGGTYSIDGDIDVRKQNIRFDAYGSGADPVFTFSANTNSVVLYDGSNDSSGFIWSNAKFDGVSSYLVGGLAYKIPIKTQTSTPSNLSNIMMLNCEAVTNGGIGSVSDVDGFFVVNCNVHDSSGGLSNVGVYSQYGSRLAVLGCNVTNLVDVEHNIRSQGCERIVISNNTLSLPRNGKQMITLRGYSNAATGGSAATWSGIWSGTAVVSDNVLDGGSTYDGLCIEFAPQNINSYGRIRTVICERNLFKGSIATGIGSELESGLTVRNNLFQSTYASVAICVDIYSRNAVGVLAGSSSWVYNNSAYFSPAQGFSFLRITKSGSLDYPTGTVAANNLVYAPNATADGTNSGGVGTFITTAASGSYYTLTTNSSDSQMDVTTPGFTIPPTTTLTTWKPTSGYGINGGTYVPVHDDFFLAQRTGTPDMGAVNP